MNKRQGIAERDTFTIRCHLRVWGRTGGETYNNRKPGHISLRQTAVILVGELTNILKTL